MEHFTLTCLLVLFYIVFHLYKLVFQKRHQSCYMLGYQCFKGSEDRMLDTESCGRIIMRNKNLGLSEYRFLLQTIVGSGIGEETYGPKNVIAGREETPTLEDALSEMEEIMFDTLDVLFAKTGVSPSEIDILVVNVSLFSPAPSLTARIVNHYKMRDDIRTYNLSGMGCSASLVSVDLVHHLFKTHRNAYAVVVSTESLAPNWYCGKEKSMILSNCLFRNGGCSMLLTNNDSLKDKAILKLNHIVRTHLGASDEAYGCCMQLEDDCGYEGFLLTRNLTKAAAQAFAVNLRVLVPKMLPLIELVRYVLKSRRRNKANTSQTIEAVGADLNMKSGAEHFCIHPGGRKVIDGVGTSLSLSDYDLEPARMALHRFGNTSAGGLWYVLGYMEAKKRLKKGHRIMMISFGAGFKCNNCVWEVMRDLKDTNVWGDKIDNYPPKDMVNPFMQKYSWINDETLSVVKLVDH